MPAPRVLVTRPAAAAAAWVAQLARHGIAADALPLIEIRPEPLAGALAQARQRLPSYAAVMFVSGNAVTALLGDKSGSDHIYLEQKSAAAPANQAQAAIETRAWSPGPGTTQALLAAGWPRARIDEPAFDAAQFDSEALWAQVAPQVRAGLRVLIVRGGDAAGRLAGRDWLAQRLQHQRQLQRQPRQTGPLRWKFQSSRPKVETDESTRFPPADRRFRGIFGGDDALLLSSGRFDILN